MEVKAYLEGILRKWWLIGLVVILCLWLGNLVANDQTSQYSASTSILINDQLLANTAFPSNTVQLDIPTNFQGKVDPPDVLYRIMRTYPRLTTTQLQNNIVTTTDARNQVMLINVTDISAAASADIANFLALHFVHAQTASLTKQMTFYQQWLQQNIFHLNNDISKLNSQISALTPQRTSQGSAPVLTPQQKLTIDEYQSKVNLDTRTLYNYQQALIEVQQALPLAPKAYVILKPAAIPEVPSSSPLSATTFELLSVVIGLILSICLIVAIDFFTPVIRHRGELQRIIGISALAELPQLLRFEQKRLLQSRRIPFMWRIKPLRSLSAAMSGLVAKSSGHTILVTSPRQKRRFAALLATSLAHKGQRTLLIDAHFDEPNLNQQIEITGHLGLQTLTGKPLSAVSKTKYTNLFLLSSAPEFVQNERVTSATLIDLLPELKHMFDIIIIDAPPIDHAVTHQLVTKVAQILLLVKKRRDSLKELKMTRAACEEVLKVNPYYVFLT